MARLEMTISPLTKTTAIAPLTKTTAVQTTSANYARPLAIVTTLFFMWGLLTSLNDILVPHLKSIFDLGYAGAMLVQFAFFSAYFLFSIPWSRVVTAIGYQRTMVAGLISMAVGALLFVPAAASASFPLFLCALVVLAAGITGLQVDRKSVVEGKSVALGVTGVQTCALPILAVGALLFVPAAASASFPLFLCALVVLAAGITGLQ